MFCKCVGAVGVLLFVAFAPESYWFCVVSGLCGLGVRLSWLGLIVFCGVFFLTRIIFVWCGFGLWGLGVC